MLSDAEKRERYDADGSIERSAEEELLDAFGPEHAFRPGRMQELADYYTYTSYDRFPQVQTFSSAADLAAKLAAADLEQVRAGMRAFSERGKEEALGTLRALLGTREAASDAAGEGGT